ncbi:MAG: hypothetical protein AAF479_14865, partial [Pseudomonadota bacterium]
IPIPKYINLSSSPDHVIAALMIEADQTNPCSGNEMFRSIITTAFMCLSLLASAVFAQDPSALQIRSADGAQASLTLAELDALEQVTITTTTIWTEGEITFTGPALSRVLELMEIDDETLILTALNDYAIEMPAPEAGATYPIIATRMDGAAMSVRDKGPFWIVFPYDSDEAFQTEEVFAQSIWQLDRIEVLE